MSHSVSPRERAWLLDEKYAGKETPEFITDLARLAAGEPLAYVIGHVPFLGATIDLSYHPLIPRTETEFWVKEAINFLRRGRRPRRILDLFAGSGCIGIALAQVFPEATVHFGEHDPNLIKQIEKNIQLNRIDATRTKIIETDIFSNITDIYDYIFANPPYIPAGRTLSPSVAHHEPHRALFAGDDGLFYVKQLLTQAPDHLVPGGTLFMEFDTEQKDAIESLTKNDARWNTINFMRDQYGAWRMVKLYKTTK